MDDYTDGEVASQLNTQALRSGEGHAFSLAIVRHLRIAYRLRSHYERLRARGMLTLDEVATRLDAGPDTIKRWRRGRLLKAHRCNDRGEYLFEPPDANAPIKHRHQGKMKAQAATKRANSHRPD